MNDVVVVFNKNNARILKNPPDLDYFRRLPNAVINPSLEKVKGLPPHFWKLEGNEIVPMTSKERKEVLKLHTKEAVDNSVDYKKNVYKTQLKALTYVCVVEFIIIFVFLAVYAIS